MHIEKMRSYLSYDHCSSTGPPKATMDFSRFSRSADRWDCDSAFKPLEESQFSDICSNTIGIGDRHGLDLFLLVRQLVLNDFNENISENIDSRKTHLPRVLIPQGARPMELIWLDRSGTLTTMSERIFL
jgi:hypothetical protein